MSEHLHGEKLPVLEVCEGGGSWWSGRFDGVLTDRNEKYDEEKSLRRRVLWETFATVIMAWSMEERH